VGEPLINPINRRRRKRVRSALATNEVLVETPNAWALEGSVSDPPCQIIKSLPTSIKSRLFLLIKISLSLFFYFSAILST
jgi:hypothetical protein